MNLTPVTFNSPPAPSSYSFEAPDEILDVAK